MDPYRAAAQTDMHAGEPLLLVPYFYLPLLSLAMHATWRLPGARNPLFHHAFPILDRAPPQVSNLRMWICADLCVEGVG